MKPKCKVEIAHIMEYCSATCESSGDGDTIFFTVGQVNFSVHTLKSPYHDCTLRFPESNRIECIVLSEVGLGYCLVHREVGVDVRTKILQQSPRHAEPMGMFSH